MLLHVLTWNTSLQNSLKILNEWIKNHSSTITLIEILHQKNKKFVDETGTTKINGDKESQKPAFFPINLLLVIFPNIRENAAIWGGCSQRKNKSLVAV
jgi:hypothetical protein